MTFNDWSYQTEPKRPRAAQEGDLSCASTLLIALLLIPLVFGGTLFLLNEVGQAYFDTDPLTIPPQIAGAMDRIGIESLLQAGQLGPARSSSGRASIDSDGPPLSRDSGHPAAPPRQLLTTEAGGGTPPGGGAHGPSAAASSAATDVTSGSLASTPSATGSPTASAVPTSSATSTSTSSPTDRPSSTPSATATAPPGPLVPTSTPVSATATSGSCTVTFNNGYEGTVLELINDARLDQGLPSFTTDSRLRSAALVHAADMACLGFFSHIGSDGSTPAERASAQGYSWSSVGENIYAGSGSYGSPSSAFQGWMDSPGHRANILSTAFTQIGVGYVYFADSHYRNYYVTVFASPQ